LSTQASRSGGSCTPRTVRQALPPVQWHQRPRMCPHCTHCHTVRAAVAVP
jgi:hypothetical protein